MEEVIKVYCFRVKETEVLFNLRFTNTLKGLSGFMGVNPNSDGVYFLFESEKERDDAIENLYWWKDKIYKVEKVGLIPKSVVEAKPKEPNREKELKKLRKMENRLRKHGIEPPVSADDLEKLLKENDKNK